MRSRRVQAWGRLDAPLILIGDAPGEYEARKGIPFVGRSGALWVSWLEEVGLSRSMFWIDNVFPYRPGKNSNDIQRLISNDEIEYFAADLHKRLELLTGPKLIVPTGNYALRALMRLPVRRAESPKITDWRGSIMQYQFSDGHKVKMIPTIHPAATFRDPTIQKVCLVDWKRISREWSSPKLRHPNPALHIDDAAVYKRFRARSRNADEMLAIDIETNPDGREILCVGFAFDYAEALTLTYTPPNFDRIRRLCGSAAQKVLQNGYGYDIHWLKDLGIPVNNYVWDTLALNHSLDATLPHGLAAQVSFYSRRRYYKKEAKESDSLGKKMAFARGIELYRYCGVDACETVHLARRHIAVLRLNLDPRDQIFIREEDIL